MKYNIIESKNYKNISKELSVNSLLAKVLDYNYSSIELMKNMLNPRLVYHDFSLFEEADLTIDRIEEAIENEEKICIYGDYDCDGILATSILVQAFHERNVNVGYHIPNRFVDGYGLNIERVKQMEEKGYSLIITVDNGVKAFDAIEYANSVGIDVIVTDHHQFDNNLPDACSFIHTKLSPDYPFKEISGGFVAYKLATALLNRQDKYLFSLAAITTVSDMMPLIDENRSLVKKALTFIKEEKYSSLELLLGNQQTYSVQTIGFTIAPKINSFGRLPEIVNPNILVKYFLKDASQDLLIKVSQKATEINAKRQSLTNEQYNWIDLEKQDDYLFFADEHLHEGLIGLIASKYTRQMNKPSFVMKYDSKSDIYKGSARSLDGFSLHDFFTSHSYLFIASGGHHLAGGFSVTGDKIGLLKQTLKKELHNVQFEETKDVILLDEDDISISSIESLDYLQPFGNGNEEPLFYLHEVRVLKYYTLSDGKHLKMDLEIKNAHLSGLFFSKGHLIEKLNHQELINIVGSLSVNEFRNQKYLNFIIKDII